VRVGNNTNISNINDPFVNNEMAIIDANYFNESLRRSTFNELSPYLLKNCYCIQMPCPNVFTFWQPWVKGYNGELMMGKIKNYDFQNTFGMTQTYKQLDISSR